MIEIKNIHKSFGKKEVLKGLNLTIPESTASCIVGKSGCGKSVMLKLIVGLLKPNSGQIFVDNKNISKLSFAELFQIRRKMGFVFQGAALFDSLDVFENVIIGLYENGQRDIKILEAEAKRTLSAVGLLPNPKKVSKIEFEKEWKMLINKKPSDLSGGMRKRVGVARALVGTPEYIFYDEPTTGLDPVNSEQIDLLIDNLAKKLKITSVIITHDMFSVYRIADNVAMIDNGIMRFQGTKNDFLKSDDEVIVEFLERYKINSNHLNY